MSSMTVITKTLTDDQVINHIKGILSKILNRNCGDAEISYFEETLPGEERVFEVYKCGVNHKQYVLKKGGVMEQYTFSKYLNKEGLNFPVPEYYGSTNEGNTCWILQEFIEGPDLKVFSEKEAVLSSKSLARITNLFWDEVPTCYEDNSRMDLYIKRIKKRKLCLKNYPRAEKAYEQFIQRQYDCPRTLSHGDLLPYNAIVRDDKVIYIDWGFSGVMPYSLDPARVILHRQDSSQAFFYASKETKKLFLTTYYNDLKHTNLTYDQFLHDIQLASLNESIEFIESCLLADELDLQDPCTEYYYNRMQLLTDWILKGKLGIEGLR